MKKLLLISVILIISCSKESENVIEVQDDEVDIRESYLTGVNKEIARIGDTVTFFGTRLDKIYDLTFNGKRSSILEKTSDSLKAIVPTVFNENLNVTAKVDGEDNLYYDMNLIGTFPIAGPNETDDFRNVEMTSKNVAFISNSNELFKTSDGGYNWSRVHTFQDYIITSEFYNESIGWVTVRGDKHKLLYTEDGGQTFNEIFNRPSGDGNTFIAVEFISPTNGYILTGKGDIIYTDDNINFNQLYTNFLNFPKMVVSGINVLVSGYSSGGQVILIVGNDNNFKNTVFQKGEIKHMQFLNDTKAFASIRKPNNDEMIIYSEDLGNSWNETNPSPTIIAQFKFIDENRGISIPFEPSNNSDSVIETTDGGFTWDLSFDFSNHSHASDLDFFDNAILVSGYRGRMWKHIF